MPEAITKEQKIKKVFDSASGNSSLVHLHTKEAETFIDTVVDESIILKQARVIKMDTPIQNIGKVGIGEKIFFPAVRGTAMDTANRVEATTDKITLTSREFIGEVLVFDDELQDNIEGEAFATHLFEMIAKAGANQLEDAFLYGQVITDYATLAIDLLQYWDGIITRAEDSGVVVDASDTAVFTNRFIDKNKLTALLKSYDTKYRKLLDGLYVPTDIMVDYEDLYNTNLTTVKGAENQTKFFGREFIDAPSLRVNRPVPTVSGVTTDLDGNVAAGETDVDVTAAAGLVVGDSITITNADAGRSHTATITVIATNKLTLDVALPYALLDEDVVTEVTLDGADILWTPKNNMIWGMQKDITIEPDRQPRIRGTVFVITARVDVQVENNDALGIVTNLASRSTFL